MSGSRLNYFLQRNLRRLVTFRVIFQQQRCRFSQLRLLRRSAGATFTIPALAWPSWGGFGKSDEATVKEDAEKKTDKDKITVIIEKADELYEANEIQELYDYLSQFQDMANDEILWRFARAAVDVGKLSKSMVLKKEKYYEAYEYIQKALELNDRNFAVHKWYAILLDYTGEFEGKKKRIENSHAVREHFLKAIELNPKDATSIHSLGQWCFVFAGLTWYEKKLASAFFATPPTSSFEEALSYFLKAEETEPNFYSMNLLMLGKTYLKLQDAKSAYDYLIRCRNYPGKTPDDKNARKEAIRLLEVLGNANKKKS